MAQGKKISDKKRSQIKAHLLECGNVRQTARKFKVAEGTVRKIRDESDDFAELHAHKKEQWINEAWKTINMYIEHVQTDKVIQKTGARDSAILIGTLHDKMIKNTELELKREELNLKRQELEKKDKAPEKPNIQVYIDALKGEMKEVFEDE
ncbi:hypothetical protein [Virgibacillus sp. Bac332]|uniref:hypothetical protein n=1 Tax=Virgibacillus sp. Bac332 TaxID=2419842 RepID=UPI000EF49B69|nr:hypothetical protein [Virgibacillus sp. Bac332]